MNFDSSVDGEILPIMGKHTFRRDDHRTMAEVSEMATPERTHKTVYV